MTSGRTLTTLLFTDIVASTEHAARLGDRRWRELLDRHDAAIRTALALHGGREVNTAGDGFVARFDDPTRALLAAWEIRERVKELGLEIRAGLHTGQVEGEGRAIGGIALHIAARVAQSAGAGQILTSRASHDAVEGAGFEFEDRGTHDLKGVPGDRRLFELTGLASEIARTAPSRRPFPGWVPRGRTALILAVAVSIIALAGLWIALGDRGDPAAGPTTAGAAPGIAVLPFTVQGADIQVWREGIVDVLSTNLDGVAGLRAIDSRTVLARWRETVGDREAVDLRKALDVATRSGAEFAVVGGIVASGTGLRLVADVYSSESGSSLGQAQVEGVSDSIFGLVDRLSVEILRTILEERGESPMNVPVVSLARVTTGSPMALKSFLEGEAALRRGEFGAAVKAYQDAVTADSAFALAWYGMSLASGFMEGPNDLSIEASARAARFADRLPERERVLLQAGQALSQGTTDGLANLRRASHRYPDDALVWYELGEAYFHLAGQALVPPGEADRAFARAIDLDPAFAPAYLHRIHHAFRFDPDSARVAQLIDRYGKLAGGTEAHRESAHGFALAFGDPATRAGAIADLDTVSFFLTFMAHQQLSHARFLETKARVLEIARRHPDVIPGFRETLLYETRLYQGKLRAASETLEYPELRERAGKLLYEAHVRGLPVPAERLAREMALGPADTTDVYRLVYAGAYAAEQLRWGEHGDALARLRNTVRHARAASDTLALRHAEGAAQALEGVALWRRGRPLEARPLLESAQRSITGHFEEEPVNATLRWWLAELLEEQGELREAELYLVSLADGAPFVTDPLASLRLARLRERLGMRKEAREGYEYFLVAWRDADPDFAPLVREAREAVARLGDLRRRE